MTPAETPTSVRAFIAVDIGDAARDALSRAQAQLRNADADVAWVRPGNIHISVAFLGDTGTDAIPSLSAMLDEAAAAQSPFSVDIAGLGAFGRPDSPRVIWAGVLRPDAMVRLQARITDGLRALNLPVESRPYTPHATLGRVKSGRNRRALADLLARFATTPFGSITISQVLLMRSILNPAGSEYSILHAAQLPTRIGP